MPRGDGNILFNDKLVGGLRRQQKDQESTTPTLSKKEISSLLYPLVLNAVEQVDGKKSRATLGAVSSTGIDKEKRRENAEKLSKILAQSDIGLVIEEFYHYWEEEVEQEDFYLEFQKHKNPLNVWSRLVHTVNERGRTNILKQELPTLSEENHSAFLRALPAPHQLVISGDREISQSPELGSWRLKKVVK